MDVLEWPVSRWHAGVVSCVTLAMFLAATQPHAAESPERTLELGDTVEVDVHLEPKASGTFIVDQSGCLKLPLLGTVKVTGMTEPELAARVESSLEKSFIRDATVAIHIKERGSLNVSVQGAVKMPGRVEFQAGQTPGLYQALASAGLPTTNADTSRIEIIRKTGGTTRSIFVNGETERMFALVEGDTVVVPAIPPGQSQVTMLGQVKNPGKIDIPPGQSFDILSAIAKAGGLTRTARESKVTVHRKNPQGEEAIVLNISRMQRGEEKPFVLLEGDTVFVPESFF